MARFKKILRFLSPGSSDFESLFAGNGSVGITLMGGARREIVKIKSIDVMNFGVCLDSQNLGKEDNKSSNYEAIKDLMKNKNYIKAQEYLGEFLAKNNFYGTLSSSKVICLFEIIHKELKVVSDYFRQVNLETGEIETRFADNLGVMSRKCFVDRESDIICFKLMGENRKIEVELKLSPVDEGLFKVKVERNSIVFFKDYYGCVLYLESDGQVSLTIDSLIVDNASYINIYLKTFVVKDNDFNNGVSGGGSVIGGIEKYQRDILDKKLKEELLSIKIDEQIKRDTSLKEESAFIKIDENTESDNSLKDSMQGGNKQSVVDSNIEFENCREIKENKDETRKKDNKFFTNIIEQAICRVKDSLKKANYDKLFRRSSQEFLKLANFQNVEFFSKGNKTIEEEIIDVKKGRINASLIESLYNFGKYLFLSGFDGRFEGGLFGSNCLQLATSTGVIGSIFSLFCGMSQNVKEYILSFYRKIPEYRENAEKIYGLQGVFIPMYQDEDSGGIVINNVQNLYDKNEGSKLCLLIYLYYRITGDSSILDKGYELISNIGEFYENFFIKDNATNVFGSPFGVSCNNKCKNTGLNIASNLTSDFAGASIVFKVLCDLCVECNDTKNLKRWEEDLYLIPSFEIDKNGVIKEFCLSKFERQEENTSIDYLFPYNYGIKVGENKKDYETLVVNSIKDRFLGALGNFDAQGLSKLMLALFTCGEGRDGGEILKTLIRNFISPSLIIFNSDYYNMGVGKKDKKENLSIINNLIFCMAIQNMFVVANKNSLYLFDNLPEFLSRGRLVNLKVSKDITLSIIYNLKRGVAKIKIKSSVDNFINIYLPRNLKKVKGKDLPEFNNIENSLKGVFLQKNKVKKIKVVFFNR